MEALAFADGTQQDIAHDTYSLLPTAYSLIPAQFELFRDGSFAPLSRIFGTTCLDPLRVPSNRWLKSLFGCRRKRRGLFGDASEAPRVSPKPYSFKEEIPTRFHKRTPTTSSRSGKVSALPRDRPPHLSRRSGLPQLRSEHEVSKGTFGYQLVSVVGEITDSIRDDIDRKYQLLVLTDGNARILVPIQPASTTNDFGLASIGRLSERRGRAIAASERTRIEADLKTLERTRLAIELHDSIAQNLTGATMELKAADLVADTDRPALHRLLALAIRTLDSCRESLRNCIWDLRNLTLDEGDVSAAVQEAVAIALRKQLLQT